jgi:hypothetical protein
LTRTTRFIADDESDMRAVVEFCDLPPGGAWRDEPGTVYSWQEERETEGTVNVYEVTRRFAPGEAIPPDYQRRGRIAGHVAGNAITLQVRDVGLAKTFTYRERYRDVATREAAAGLLLQHFAGWVGRFADAAQRELPGGATPAQARAAIEASVGRAMTRLVRGIGEEGSAFFRTTVWTDEVVPLFERDAAVAAVMERLPPPPGQDPAAWADALRRAHDGAGDLFDTSSEEGLEERVFGVHGGPSGMKFYRFRHRLALPGEVTASNATRTEDKALLWEFESDAFLWQDYVLEARSRLWLPRRLLLALIALLGVALAARRGHPPSRRARRPRRA